jgi:FkbM family methyltransferase
MQHLLNSAFFANELGESKISVIDGGARGELFSPLNRIDTSRLQVIRFEPDAEAEIVGESDDIVVSKALWSEKTELTLNVAVEPSASSVLPFNRELQQHIDPFLKQRSTAKTVKLDAISIDDFVRESDIDGIDFIKLDIHGAEYEVLKGAGQTLDKTLGLLVESWIIPIHKGQKTRAHVEALAGDHGFYVFEENMRSEWGRRPKEFHKRQPVALDTLFFRDPMLDDAITSKTQALKLIGLADVFEHHAYAIQLSEYFGKKGILEDSLVRKTVGFIRSNARPGLKEKVLNKLRKLSKQKLNSSTFK